MSTQINQYNELYGVLIFGIAIFFLLLSFIIYAILKANKRRFQHAKEKADLEASFQQSLLQSKIEIQEQAFNNISQELHDNIGQQLSLTKLNLSTLKEVNNTQDKEKIATAKELVSDTIYQIRSIAKTLLGEKVSCIGIAESVKNEVERINKLDIIEMVFNPPEEKVLLNPQYEIILFRIIQEAINNIIKHAAATKTHISMHYEKKNLTVLIQDNGKGFKLEGESNTGIGLMNMKNRAHAIGANLNINSVPNKGTVIEILLRNPI